MMRTLNKALQDFSFVNREVIDGKKIANKCGRDFLYYSLNYYIPKEFNSSINSPELIDKKNLFGVPTVSWLAWTQVQFIKLPKLLHNHNLRLSINDQEISSYFKMFKVILFSRKSYTEAITEIQTSINRNEVVGVDISLGMFGLLDHVMFVYGYDDENLYVFDTHKTPALEYDSIQDSNYFKLPKSIVKKRWTRFGRVWKVSRIS